MPEILENANEDLTPRMRNLLALLWSEWKDLVLQIVAMNEEVERIASNDAACLRLRQVPGIGPLVAIAIFAPWKWTRTPSKTSSLSTILSTVLPPDQLASELSGIRRRPYYGGLSRRRKEHIRCSNSFEDQSRLDLHHQPASERSTLPKRIFSNMSSGSTLASYLSLELASAGQVIWYGAGEQPIMPLSLPP